MNTIIEAVKKDGTRALVPTSLIKGYADEARTVANGRTNRAMRLIGQMIANLMYVRGYKSLTQIRYDGDGSQWRALLMVAM